MQLCVTVMASLSAYSVTEPLGLTLGSQCTLETVLRGIYFLMIFFIWYKTAKTKVKTELVKVFYKTNISILNLE